MRAGRAGRAAIDVAGLIMRRWLNPGTEMPAVAHIGLSRPWATGHRQDRGADTPGQETGIAFAFGFGSSITFSGAVLRACWKPRPTSMSIIAAPTNEAIAPHSMI